MTAPQPARPWYVPNRLVDEYCEVGRRPDGDLTMIKTIKAVQSLIANIGVVILGLVAIHYGADPTYVGTAGIVTLGLLNGVLALDYAAVARAVVELSQEDLTKPSDNDE